MCKILKKLILFSTILISVACSSSQAEKVFPTVIEHFVSNVTIDNRGFDTFALSPDGKTVIDQYFIETNLENGDSNRRFGDLDLKYGWGGILIGWSIDGRYLAATQLEFAPDNTITDKPVIIIDTATNSVRYYPGAFNGWSAVNSERFMTNNFTPTNVSDGSEIRDWESIDFRNAKVKGNGNFLWDIGANLPIAYMKWKPILDSSGAETGSHTDEIVSYDKGETIQVEVYIETSNQRTVSSIFDPTGQYVLLTIWERSEIPAEGNNDISGKNVVDTVLMLVNWRTQKQAELFRFSSLEDGNVIALPNATAWSADGSTIFVARKDAPAVVLRIKYP